MTKLDTPVCMTVAEANKKFRPNSYLMVNCGIEYGAVIAGQVIAYAPLDAKGPLVDYAWELSEKGECGEIFTNDTRDPLDGGPLLIEYDISE